MNEPAALQIEFRRSRIAGVLTLADMIAAAALVAWLPLEPWQRLLAVSLLGVYGIALVGAWAGVQRHAWSLRLRWEPTGTSRSSSAASAASKARCRTIRTSGPCLTTSVWRTRGARASRTIAILPDMLPAEDFRKLRVLLRLGKVPTPH